MFFLGCVRDPNFANCVDGLVVDTTLLKEKKRQGSLLGFEENDDYIPRNTGLLGKSSPRLDKRNGLTFSQKDIYFL